MTKNERIIELAKAYRRASYKYDLPFTDLYKAIGLHKQELVANQEEKRLNALAVEETFLQKFETKTPDETTLLESYRRLNTVGKHRALSWAIDLTGIEKYLKEDESA